MVSKIIFIDVRVKELVISMTSNINQLEKNTRGACVINPDKIENDVSLCIIKVLSSGLFLLSSHLVSFITNLLSLLFLV